MLRNDRSNGSRSARLLVPFNELSTLAVVAAMTFAAMVGTQLSGNATAGATAPVKANSVTFTSTPPTISSSSSQVLGIVGTTYVPIATARSGNDVIFTIDGTSSSGACSLSGGVVSFEVPGVCIIDANDPGTGSYLAAPQEQQSIDVNYAPTCATLAYQEPSAPNGDYTLDVQGVSTTIYCADMSTSPSEYLDLPAGTSTNFSQLGSHWGGGSTGAISTTYTKVRFYPSTLQIENADTQFASSSGSNGENGADAVAWGIAAGCDAGVPGTYASFEVDLEGTPFDFTFGMSGFGAAGFDYDGAPMVADDTTNQAFSDTNVNGFCGHAGFHSPNPGGPGFAGVWGTPSNGAGSFLVDVSQINSSDQVIVGQPLSFVQTSASPLAQRTVQTTVDGIAPGATASYISSGACSVNQSGLLSLHEVGTCTVVVSSSSFGDAIAATPVTESFQVLGAQSIDITSSDSHPVAGSTYSLTSTAGGSGNPVIYSIDSQSTGDCQLEASGTVVLLETPGICIVDALQQGDADYLPASQQKQTIIITKAATSTAVSSNGGPSAPAASVMFTAEVMAVSPATGTPTGTVSFTDGSSVLCSRVTISDGSATCTAHLLVRPTSQTVTATYSGSASMLGSAGTTMQSLLSGYWLVGSDGSVRPYGEARGNGSMAGRRLNKPMVGMSATPDAKGYWLAAADGGVFAFGDATFFGSATRYKLRGPIVGIVRTSDGGGYYLLGSDGGVFAFGDATLYGSAAHYKLAGAIKGMVLTPDGKGYYLVGSDGGVFAFGDAVFHGSASGSVAAGTPVVGLAQSADLGGYWLVLSTGRVLTFGVAPYYGSTTSISAQVVAITATADEVGYWVVSADGNVYSFGDAGFDGPQTHLSVGVDIVGFANT